MCISVRLSCIALATQDRRLHFFPDPGVFQTKVAAVMSVKNISKAYRLLSSGIGVICVHRRLHLFPDPDTCVPSVRTSLAFVSHLSYIAAEEMEISYEQECHVACKA